MKNIIVGKMVSIILLIFLIFQVYKLHQLNNEAEEIIKKITK